MLFSLSSPCPATVVVLVNCRCRSCDPRAVWQRLSLDRQNFERHQADGPAIFSRHGGSRIPGCLADCCDCAISFAPLGSASGKLSFFRPLIMSSRRSFIRTRRTSSRSASSCCPVHLKTRSASLRNGNSERGCGRSAAAAGGGSIAWLAVAAAACAALCERPEQLRSTRTRATGGGFQLCTCSRFAHRKEKCR